ncbi:MAG: holin [Candidatus Onthovivens sp.]|nr:holin [Candidatus Onthovivens sp.]
MAAIGTTTAMGEVDWIFVGSTALVAGIISMLTSIAGLPEMKMGQGE